MRASLGSYAVAALVLAVSATSWAQTDVPVVPSAAPAPDVVPPPPPTSPPLLELPDLGAPPHPEATWAPEGTLESRQRAAVARRPTPGLLAGEFFAALGNQLGMSAAMAGTAAMIVYGVAAATSQANCEDLCINRSDENVAWALMAVLAPPLLALPSSHAVYGMSNARSGQRRPWGWTYLSAVLANAAMMGVVAALASQSDAGISSRDAAVGSLVTLGVGSVLSAGVQVLTLNLTETQAVAAPMVLKDGGGMMLALGF